MLKQLRFWIDDLSTREALVLGAELAMALVALSLLAKLFFGAEAVSPGQEAVRSATARQFEQPSASGQAQPAVDEAENRWRAELFERPLPNNTAELFDLAQPDDQQATETASGVAAPDKPSATLPAQILFGPLHADPAQAEVPPEPEDANPQIDTHDASGQIELFGAATAAPGRR